MNINLIYNKTIMILMFLKTRNNSTISTTNKNTKDDFIGRRLIILLNLFIVCFNLNFSLNVKKFIKFTQITYCFILSSVV